jgi:hypothetical protein
MNSQYSKIISLTEDYTAIDGHEVFFCGVVAAPSANTTTAYIQSSDGNQDIPISPGEFHEYKAVNLLTVKVKGTSPATLIVVGEEATVRQ